MSPEDLQGVERAFAASLRAGEAGDLRVLGYGEISTVVACDTASGAFACKRLPPFEDQARLEAYSECLDAYVRGLSDAGINVVESRLLATPADRGIAAYCVQPILEPAGLGQRHLAAVEPAAATALFERLLDTILGCVTPQLGLDAQISNWWICDGELHYLDVTTPLMRDAQGRNLLDVELFMASVPWLLGGLVKRFLIEDIIDDYHDPRKVVVDLLANLHKERLAHLIPGFLTRANRRLQPEITEDEVLTRYRDDARTWALVQRLRRLDRWWQQKIRRRVYPFLLPGPIDRHV